MKKLIFITLFFALILTACNGSSGRVKLTDETASAENSTSEQPQGMMGRMMGGMMGEGGGMMQRHMATIPEEYAGLTNPISVDDESLQRGQELYTTLCISCHGDSGMGDGPAGEVLDPAPAPVAHTSQMMGDDYLFWRISEGGVQFSSAMPGWKASLDEDARWDIINYVRALGSGQINAEFNRMEADMQAQMLSGAVEQGVITQDEADIFSQMHTLLDQQRGPGKGGTAGNMADMQGAVLSALVEDGTITQTQADEFVAVRDRLFEAGVAQ